MKAESINLFFKRGSSDKVYQVQLKQVNPGTDEWHVHFQYGRRGGTLVGGVKNANPLRYWPAKRMYDTLVRSKVRKGYKPKTNPTVSYTPYSDVYKAVTERKTTNFLPQLLKQVTLTEAKKLYKANIDNIYMQIKHDGERRGVLIGEKVIPANRKGLETQIQQNVSDACSNLTENWTDILELDTEDMGSHLVLFDVLQVGGEDIRNKMFQHRSSLLRTLKMSIDSNGLEHQLKVDIPYVPESYEEFMDYINYARETNEEGVCIKIGSGIYEPGLGDYAFKLKFYADATVFVDEVHATKRSVSISVVNADGIGYVNVGNCAIPANREIPRRGELVEVRYLYAYPGGSLYQPFYKGVRLDKSGADYVNTLQFKKGA